MRCPQRTVVLHNNLNGRPCITVPSVNQIPEEVRFMRSISGAFVISTIMLLGVLVTVIPPDAEASGHAELHCTGVEYEDRVMKVAVDRDVDGEVFSVYIDGVEQMQPAFGQEDDWILLPHQPSGEPESYVLKSDSFDDVTFTYPEFPIPLNGEREVMVYVILAVVVALIIGEEIAARRKMGP